ncbi:MAG TPA: S8 family serine peptidase [Casimicrobiaceae bacterium]
MSTIRLWLLLLPSLWVAACAATPPRSEAAVDSASLERQVLVMLRLPAPHFRPDVSYTGGYDWRVGRDARRQIAAGLAARYGLKVIDSWPMPALGVDCFVMEAPANASLPQLLGALSLDSRVEWAQSMQLFRVLARNDPLYALQPSAKLWHLAELHKIATGKHVRVAEVDTGVEVDHPDLAGRVAVAKNFVDSRRDVAELHGTEVAGIIAARADDGLGIAGIAPDAKLLSLRACWQSARSGDAASCSTFTLAKALQFALDENVQVINLSLGGPRDRLLERLLDVALSRGITVVGAADPEVANGGFPASHPGVLAVAGDDGQDVAGDILLAPGTDIPTTITDQRWGFVTGSSFAAAHVTGLVALLRELAPDLKPDQLRQALAPPARPGTHQGPRLVVDACAAVGRAAGTCACACAVARDNTRSPSTP